MILGLFFPPYLLALEFKSREELQLMPQTMEEHLDELEEGGEVESQRRNSVSSFDESQVNEEYNVRQAAGNLIVRSWCCCGSPASFDFLHVEGASG